jgi:hypothetical protein
LSSLSELEIRQRLKDDFPHYASRCLKIRTKNGAIEPLVLNKAQLYLHSIAEQQRKETGKVRIIGLKGRQQGFSTYVEGRIYWRVTHQKGVMAFILTHEDEATKNLFSMANRFHDHCPELVRPHTGAANANELNFDLLDSGYKVGTARTKGTGRSSTLQFFHWSEVAHSQNAEEHVSGVLQAVPDMVGTEIFLESTANGIGNFFHQAWQKAESGDGDYKAVFIPWYWQDEYRREEDITLSPEEQAYADFYQLDRPQMAWRRAKIEELKSDLLFKQEYPATAAEAFQVTGIESYIPVDLILRARKKFVDPYGALLVGVDPARFGDDRTAIAYRRTRKVTKIDTFLKKDTMEVAGICSRILKHHQPIAMFIDVVGIGAGVVDRLRELGWGERVFPVNAGQRAFKDKLYSNHRAEMWGEMKHWFENGPVQIPDEDAIQADLQGPGFKFDSNQRLVLEKKEDMKKRGVRSPDMADAIALTFSQPINASLPPMIQQEPELFGINE